MSWSRCTGSASARILVVAGDGPLRNRFERDVAARGLEAFVHVLGDRNDIPQILAAIDVFILTSDSKDSPAS